MTMIAQAIMYLWPLVVVVIFASAASTRRAMIASFVSGWLALPVFSMSLPGIPDYSKMSATVIGVLLGTMLFDQSRVAALRLRWFDSAPLTWCLGASVTALSNGLGPYEAASVLLRESLSWGFPYFIGRVYLTDAESVRELGDAIIVGTLCYVPLCLFEIRFSPLLASWIYGYQRWDGMRYGGFRPKVFLVHGLELGIWMTNATLLAFVLWDSKATRRIRGFPMGLVLVVIAGTTVLCKSTGALLLLAFGLILLRLAKRNGRVWLVGLTVAIAPAYTITRSTQLWGGRELVTCAKLAFGGDRAQSLEYRLEMEDLLIGHANQRPLLGWGGFGRNLITTSTGYQVTIPDGFWILAKGIQGYLGLASLLAMFLIPMILTIRRFPTSRWSDPQVAPVVGVGLVLTLTMIDYLSNAMLNPIYPLMIAAVCNQESIAIAGSGGIPDHLMATAAGLAAEGRFPEAEMAFREGLEYADQSGQDDLEIRTFRAEMLDGLGQALLAADRPDRAAMAFQDALIERDVIAAESPEPGRFRDLAIAREQMARALAALGDADRAIGERRIALWVWERLAASDPSDPNHGVAFAKGLNDLAWLLATEPAATARDPGEALALAEQAVHLAPDDDAFWNTLGVARYRAGDWTGAIEVLERSAMAAPGGTGTAFDHYFLAMAWSQLQHEDRAREWLEFGIAWTTRHRPSHPLLERFRREAESLA